MAENFKLRLSSMMRSTRGFGKRERRGAIQASFLDMEKRRGGGQFTTTTFEVTTNDTK